MAKGYQLRLPLVVPGGGGGGGGGGPILEDHQLRDTSVDGSGMSQ